MSLFLLPSFFYSPSSVAHSKKKKKEEKQATLLLTGTESFFTVQPASHQTQINKQIDSPPRASPLPWHGVFSETLLAFCIEREKRWTLSLCSCWWEKDSVYHCARGDKVMKKLCQYFLPLALIIDNVRLHPAVLEQSLIIVCCLLKIDF